MDYKSDIAKLPPFTLIAGTQGEAFVAEAYAPLMKPLTDKGRYHLITGVSHLDVVNDPRTETLIRATIREF